MSIPVRMYRFRPTGFSAKPPSLGVRPLASAGRLAEERGTSRMPRIHTVTHYDRKQP